jgi:hypothetical protein
MRRKPFQGILHPPEVKGTQQRRYWIAVAGWFIFILLGIAILGGLELWAIYLLEHQLGSNALTDVLGFDEIWLLAGTLMIGVLGIFLGDYLWGLLFIKTGYLSREAVIRIRTNRAPTARGEGIHRRISLSLAVLIPVALVWVGWYLESWWMMSLMLLLGVWLFWSVWSGWQNADAMAAGNQELPPDLEKRVTHDLDKPA